MEPAEEFRSQVGLLLLALVGGILDLTLDGGVGILQVCQPLIRRVLCKREHT